MRSSVALVWLATLAACGDTQAGPPATDASPAPPPDAPVVVEDLNMQLADFKNIPGLMTPPGRTYKVANPLGHEAEALAAASSPTGGTFPVGSIVEVQRTEVMVKRRRGFDATTDDWEFFGIAFAPDGVTPESFAVRGVEETQCFMCHSQMSSRVWDYMCEHP
ncbi:MAG TPA: hypothetical protein VKE22_02885 [Haliangiales bacterium]|nr:hypothetical protein [Haliangiales bacterium]